MGRRSLLQSFGVVDRLYSKGLERSTVFTPKDWSGRPSLLQSFGAVDRLYSKGLERVDPYSTNPLEWVDPCSTNPLEWVDPHSHLLERVDPYSKRRVREEEGRRRVGGEEEGRRSWRGGGEEEELERRRRGGELERRRGGGVGEEEEGRRRRGGGVGEEEGWRGAGIGHPITVHITKKRTKTHKLNNFKNDNRRDDHDDNRGGPNSGIKILEVVQLVGLSTLLNPLLMQQARFKLPKSISQCLLYKPRNLVSFH